MRKSLETFIDTCQKVKKHLQVSSFELHDYEDGDYAEFRVQKITDPRGLLLTAGQHQVRIYTDNGKVVETVYEDVRGY